SQTSTLSPNRNASVQSPNFEAQKTEYHVLSAVVPSLIIIIIMGIIIIIIMGTIIRRQRNSQIVRVCNIEVVIVNSLIKQRQKLFTFSTHPSLPSKPVRCGRSADLTLTLLYDAAKIQLI
ncbi:hypothetical protein QTP70_034080, partial [Hemibagrus guttatus]